MESTDADVQAVAKMRAKIKKLEQRMSTLRSEVHAMEASIFKRCQHEWEKTEDEDVAGFWYSYCPWTCKHCGFFRSGPVKYW